MGKYLDQNQVFPLAMGNEEETGLMIDTYGEMSEPDDLVSDLEYLIPTELVGFSSNAHNFLLNGSKVYPGGSEESMGFGNLERATPECKLPKDIVPYDKASQYLLEQIVKTYLKSESSDNHTVNARIQRRVVDSHGNRKASHDNFGIANNTPLNVPGKNNYATASILEHFATRSLVTGAGMVTDTRFKYAQKIGGLLDINSYSYRGSMFRTSREEGGYRFEVRCSDINISDWAVWMRMGSTALVLALNQTPLEKELDKYVPQNYDSILLRTKQVDNAKLGKNGRLTATPEQIAAIDFQQYIAELAMDELPRYVGEIPHDYFNVAMELYNFCQDYKSVVSGQSEINLLADRADWAAKLSFILRGIEKDRDFGINRQTTDIEARAADLRYDSIEYSAKNGEVKNPVYGNGYRMRDKGIFRRTVSPIAIQKAYRNAPSDTRANQRSKILSKYVVANCDWATVSVLITGNARHHVSMDDVTQPELKKYESESLALNAQLRIRER